MYLRANHILAKYSKTSNAVSSRLQEYIGPYVRVACQWPQKSKPILEPAQTMLST